MDRRRINLALQGGGAHGAFTWGVLDRLLDEDWLDIAAISGTSAGALNGAALQAVRVYLNERLMLERIYKPAEVRALLAKGDWPPK